MKKSFLAIFALLIILLVTYISFLIINNATIFTQTKNESYLKQRADEYAKEYNYKIYSMIKNNQLILSKQHITTIGFKENLFDIDIKIKYYNIPSIITIHINVSSNVKVVNQINSYLKSSYKL